MDCGFRVALPPLGTVCFSDRAREAGWLLNLAGRGSGVVLVVYGPEGCGKSTLLRYVVWRVAEAGGVGVYVDALAGGDVEEAVFPLTSTVREVIGEVVGSIAGSVGRVLAAHIGAFIGRLMERVEVSGKRVVVVVDDVYRALGLGEAEGYTKRLYELLRRLYEAGASSALVVAATSEGVSRRLLSRHGFTLPLMMWNMGLEGFRELLGQVELPGGLSVEGVWRLTGGNPRGVSQLATLGWSVENWLRVLAERVRPAIEAVGAARARRLVEDPDSDPEAARILEEHNLMMELSRASALGEPPEPNPELGIGERWAWQMPALRLAAAMLLGKLS